jgi:hypothetical protein
MDDTFWIRNSLSVVRTGSQELHILTTVYPESDALNAGGQLLCHTEDEEGMTRSVLRTSRPLTAMWRSPRQRLWLGSADGHAWTSASVPWSVPERDVIEGTRWTWSLTRLPALEGKDRPPNITAIWGTSDWHVFFATASGAIYRWDGENWHLTFAGGGSLTKMHGVDSHSAYAVGYEATLVHWDGKRWLRIEAPALDPEITIVTGVAMQKSGHVYAVTNRGQVLKREGDVFNVVAKDAVSFTGLVAWKGVLAASSTNGAWLYSDSGGLRRVKRNVSATDLMVVRNELHFIETDQPQGPAVIEYQAKRIEAPWQRLVF